MKILCCFKIIICTIIYVLITHKPDFTPQYTQDKYLPTIGILLPMPKALGDTLKIGGV